MSDKAEAPQATPQTTKPRMEPVRGEGGIARIRFDGEPAPAKVAGEFKPVKKAPAPEPTPEPEPEPAPRLDRTISTTTVRRHSSGWSIDDIHRAVDSLHRYQRTGLSPRLGEHSQRPESTTVYKTDGGVVRSSTYSEPTGDKKIYYTNRGLGREDTRFYESQVDRILRNAKPTLDGGATRTVTRETTTVKETVRSAPEPWTPTPRAEIDAPTTKPAATSNTPPAAKAPEAKPSKASKPKRRKKSKAYFDYKGDIHPVREIEGIGPSHAAKLVQAGVETSARLCYEDAAKLAAETGIPEKTVRSWQVMSELAKAPGIGPQYAEVMARAGITGIEDLRSRDAEEVCKQINDYLGTLKTNVVGTKITPKRVAGWQEKCKGMKKVRQSIPEA